MRITGGTLRGKKLLTPQGKHTRPTGAKERESLFNILTHGIWADNLQTKHLCDGFAGCGSVGIEALSRGFAHVTFIEYNASTHSTLLKNLELIDDASKWEAPHQSLYRLRYFSQFDIIFLDPPYIEHQHQQRSLEHVVPWAKPNGLIVLQAPPSQQPPNIKELEHLREHKIGNALFHFYEIKPI